MKAQEVESKVEENVNGWGEIYCAECEIVLCLFPPYIEIDEDSELEFYCPECAMKYNNEMN